MAHSKNSHGHALHDGISTGEWRDRKGGEITGLAGVCRLRLVEPGPATAWERGGLLWHPSGIGEGVAQQQLNLGVEAPKLVRRPPGEGIVHRRVNPEEDRLALAGHE
jgi:hypothetical protein